MRLFVAIKSGFDVLHAGKSLNNAEAWKNAQAVTVLLTTIVGVLNAVGLHVVVDSASLESVAMGISGAFTIYLTYATSKSVGVPKAEDEDEDEEKVKPDAPVAPAARLQPTLHQNVSKPGSKVRSDLPDLP